MDTGEYFKFMLALVFVLGLIGGLALLMRRYGFGVASLRKGTTGRRLQVVEVSALDARRRLVLVRRDSVEHLILLGMNNEMVIESNIDQEHGEDAPPVSGVDGP
jgi:flagellar protein FliO/FliZ